MDLIDLAVIAPLNVDLLYAGGARLPALGEEVYFPQFDIQLGGGPALLPIVLRRLGLSCRLGTFLADDLPGRMARHLLNDLGFGDADNLLADGATSPLIVTSVVSVGAERAFVSHAPVRATPRLEADAVYQHLHGARVCFAVREHPEVMRRLRADGTRIVFDCGWEDDMRLEDFAEVLAQVDVFTPNAKEAMQLTNTATVEDAARALARQVPHAIVTDGASGCLTVLEGELVRVPPPEEFSVVDTTGAGDNFLAGVVYGLAKGWAVRRCMAMGNALGGLSTTAIGCFAALRSRSESELSRYLS